MIPRLVPSPISPSGVDSLAALVDAPARAGGTRSGGVPRELLPAFMRVPGNDALLARLATPDLLLVTTGQQPALFSGPLYTVHKALSTAALARTLEERWGRPVAPVFWAAGDDHDFAEAAHAEWLAPDGSVTGAALPPRPAEAPLTPMYREPLGAAVSQALDALARDLAPSEFRDWTLEWLARHYTPDATMGSAFATALAELLAPHGIAVFDSTHPAVKRAAAPLLMDALRRAAALDGSLAKRAQVLAREGHDAGIAAGDGATLVMVECRMGRDRLLAHEHGFTTRRGKTVYDLAHLEALAAREPERFSPNVLLRPVLESALLPTVAYTGGPGELRYLRLTPSVYETLGVRPQAVVPRWSGAIVEPRIERVLEKFAISLHDLMQPPGALEARLVRSRLPEGVTGALAELRRAIEAGYEPIARSAVEIDPTLEKTVQAARQHALTGTADIEKKLVQHLKRREETELAQIARARHAVWPNGKPQERVLTAAPFLARHGPTLLDALIGEMRRWYAAALEGAARPA
ncbi:MAG TPA: bacillithiol biosynthesis cysteine-adding enzyme BshC [Gemmatimonadales bacterium]|nr:bacillithiol biosynthesis cysteine-adding enzyme BshC [Gemmatimonadales bacterium]